MIGNIKWEELVCAVCQTIEERFDVLLDIDGEALDELDEIAKRTIGSYELAHPNPAKVAGHVVFWFRRLRPVTHRPESQNKLLVANETAALYLGLSICDLYRGEGSKETFHLPARVMKDWIASLRYNSHSPHAIAIAFEILTAEH
ncbi:hypothetical protein D3877_17435 [Azospirillum cavernae]|uniref:Uncharacterized protein n=1 Tax=Azospirillum cavernae TaxID=2320860 RepID=A0A418VXN7_9PROT|nr:hypothetical protein [Azospirillum cavernae]RJF81880.1 hypothetical protein D3877_17435 [Azospirillum cavernae]